MKPELVCCGCGEKWHRYGSGYESDNGFYVGCYPLVATFCPECLLDRMTGDKLVEFAASCSGSSKILSALADTNKPLDLPQHSVATLIRSMYAYTPGETLAIVKEILKDQLFMEELIAWMMDKEGAGNKA